MESRYRKRVKRMLFWHSESTQAAAFMLAIFAIVLIMLIPYF